MSACPINYTKIDKNIAKVVNAFVLMAIFLGLAFQNSAIFMFLAFDFGARTIPKNNLSLFYLAGAGVAKYLSFKEANIDFAAKKVAFGFGAILSLALTIFALLGPTLLFNGLGTVFAACVFLELFFDYCIGCKIYYLFTSFFPRRVLR